MWYDEYITDFKATMFMVGVDVDDVQFTGFWSQGDGASFTFDARDVVNKQFLTYLIESEYWKGEGSSIDPREFTARYNLHKVLPMDEEMEKLLELLFENLLISSERSTSRYSHEMTCSMNIDSEEHEDLTDELLDGIQAAAEKWRIDECHRLYNILEEGYSASGQADLDEAFEEEDEI